MAQEDEQAVPAARVEESESPEGTCLGLERARARLLDRVNALRSEGTTCPFVGARPSAFPLSRDEALDSVAQAHAQDMAARGFFSHVNPDGEGPVQRVAGAGIHAEVAENLAWGPWAPEDAVGLWTDSPEHCTDLMARRWRRTGIGYICAEKVIWVQVFAP